eukprot:7132952-Pyramimonas_sp.AAC.1
MAPGAGAPCPSLPSLTMAQVSSPFTQPDADRRTDENRIVKDTYANQAPGNPARLRGGVPAKRPRYSQRHLGT